MARPTDLLALGAATIMAWSFGQPPAPPPPPALDLPAIEDGLASAVRLSRQHVERDPYDPLAPVLLAEVQLELAGLTGDGRLYVEAEAMLERALALAPHEPLAAEALLARAALARHRFAEASRRAAALWRQHPGKSFLLALWGDAELEQGHLDAARARFELLARRQPGMAATVRLARLAHLEGDADRALELLARALGQTRPSEILERVWIHVQGATMQRGRGRLREAEVAADAALALVPEHPFALTTRADIHAARGQLAAARALLARAIRRHREPEFVTRLARVLERMGQPTDAELLWAEAQGHYESEIGAGDVGHLRAMATLLLDRGRDPRRALELARRDAQVRGDIHADHLLARACRAAGLLEEARRHARASLRLGTPEAHLYAEAARISRALGRDAEAAGHLARARELGA